MLMTMCNTNTPTLANVLKVKVVSNAREKIWSLEYKRTHHEIYNRKNMRLDREVTQIRYWL